MFSGATRFNSELSQWPVRNLGSMRFMFNGSSTFNQNLCTWRDKLPLSRTVFESTFVGTACASKLDPNPPTQGPYCAICGSNLISGASPFDVSIQATSSPTNQPSIRYTDEINKPSQAPTFPLNEPTAMVLSAEPTPEPTQEPTLYPTLVPY